MRSRHVNLHAAVGSRRYRRLPPVKTLQSLVKKTDIVYVGPRKLYKTFPIRQMRARLAIILSDYYNAATQYHRDDTVTMCAEGLVQTRELSVEYYRL